MQLRQQVLKISLNTGLRWLVLGLSIGLVHCSGVKFGTHSATTASTAEAAGTTTPTGDGAAGTVTQPPTPTPIVLAPKVKFVGPPCVRGTACLIEFDLAQAMTKEFDFNWATNDTLYMQSGAPAGFVYGKPGYHYVSTSGHVSFAPGETVKQVYVQNINPDNTQIIIGVVMSACTFGGNIGNCTDYFQ